MNPNEAPKTCKCGHHKIMPLAIILIALDVILANYGVWSVTTGITIGAILLIIGAFPKLMHCKCCGPKSA